LAKAHPDGESNLKLSKNIGISRWTVSRWCKELIQGGLVSQDEGKFGEYHLSELALGAPSLQGDWLEKIAYDSLISRYTSPNSTIQEKLSALVVTFGIYNTYVMIQAALERDFHPSIGIRTPGIQEVYKILKSRQRPDTDIGNLVKTRLEGAIHPMQMLLQLCRLVISKEKLNRYGSTTSDTPTTPSELILSGSLFEENKIAFEDLKKAFTDFYREDFRQLEGIRKEQAPITAWSHLKAKYRKYRKTASIRH
jgi:hypothetical protein